MRGEPIESVKVGMADMVATLRQDPYALETVCISIITFDSEVKQLVPLTPLADLQLPDIVTPESGPTLTGAALQMLCKIYDSEVQMGTPQKKGDWMPLLFLMTDGKPADIQLYKQMTGEVKRHQFTNIVACAAGPKAQTEPLKLLTDNVFSLENMDSNSFKKFFQWVTLNIGAGGKSVGTTDSVELPEPPKEVNLVI